MKDLLSWLLQELKTAEAIPSGGIQIEAIEKFVEQGNKLLATKRFAHVMQLAGENLELRLSLGSNDAVTLFPLEVSPAPTGPSSVAVFGGMGGPGGIAPSPSIQIFDGKSRSE